MKIAIHGLAGSGKDTFANYLEELFKKEKLKYIRTAFANPLKDLLSDSLGIERSLFDCPERKDKPVIKDTSPRDLMTFVGTDVFRKIDNDVWVNLTMKTVAGYDNVIITDVRFDNELERLKKEGFYTIKINRPHVKRIDHESERGIDTEFFDDSVININVEGLKTRAEQIFNMLFTKSKVEIIGKLLQPYFGYFVNITDGKTVKNIKVNLENFNNICYSLSAGWKLKLKPMYSLLSEQTSLNEEILEEFSLIEQEHYENTFCTELGRPLNWKDTLSLSQYEILLESSFDVWDLHSHGLVTYI